jgi:transcriptional regulator with XRE-family HTH domain
LGAPELGRRIAQLREQAGLKQADLARQITWSQAVLSRVEGGERSLSDDELQTLLDAIGSAEAGELGDAVRRRWRFLERPSLNHPDQDHLWAADEILAALNERSGRPDIRAAFASRLAEYQKEIQRIAGLLRRTEHQVAFIGSIGTGKSTAICRATGLETPGPNGRPRPVLEVGAGGVTFCEVHLSSGPEYGIVIEPLSNEAIREVVTDFAEQVFRLASDASGDAAAAETRQSVPREIDRAIRNMAGLAPQRPKGSDGKPLKGADGKPVKLDPAGELARTVPSSRELVVEVLSRMNLLRRDRRDVWYGIGIAREPLDWMRDTFAEINNGRHPDFSLPARIELVVPDLISIGDVSVSIIDTRGIDQPTARADLEAQLSDPHTVAILCSRFNDAPEQTIQQLLQRARDADNPQIASHSAILVLPRAEEATNVKDESGIPVDSSEDGYALKDEQVSNALVPHGLESLATLFFNAFEDDPQTLREFLDLRVTSTRNGLRQRLDEVLANAMDALDKAEEQQAQEEQEQAARTIKNWIELNADPKPAAEHVQDALLGIITRDVHPATVHAAVRRQGEWQSLSYSHHLGYGSRRLAVLALRDRVESFKEHCATLSKTLPDAAELLSQASRLMAQAYEELLSKMRLAGVAMYGNALQGDLEIWAKSEAEWGRGPGYRDRVASHSRDWFDGEPRRELEAEIRSVLTREWTSVLNRVGAIFGLD